MFVSLVVAMDENGLIGADKGLPWHLPADLRRFKQITMGHPVVMGRTTWESIGKPLPGRRNLVLSSDREYRAEGATVVHSLTDALALVYEEPEVMIIGGAGLYQQALPTANRIFLTTIHAEFSGDTWFPDFDRDRWRTVSQETFKRDERNPYDFTFSVLERIPHREDWLV